MKLRGNHDYLWGCKLTIMAVYQQLLPNSRISNDYV